MLGPIRISLYLYHFWYGMHKVMFNLRWGDSELQDIEVDGEHEIATRKSSVQGKIWIRR